MRLQKCNNSENETIKRITKQFPKVKHDNAKESSKLILQDKGQARKETCLAIRHGYAYKKVDIKNLIIPTKLHKNVRSKDGQRVTWTYIKYTAIFLNSLYFL